MLETIILGPWVMSRWLSLTLSHVHKNVWASVIIRSCSSTMLCQVVSVGVKIKTVELRLCWETALQCLCDSWSLELGELTIWTDCATFYCYTDLYRQLCCIRACEYMHSLKVTITRFISCPKLSSRDKYWPLITPLKGGVIKLRTIIEF